MNPDTLKESFDNRTASVGVIGLGYVGLPLAVAFVDAGYSVVGFDVNQNTVDRICEGHSHIRDITSDAVAGLLNTGRFSATTDMSRLSEVNAICICVPTPLSDLHDPDISYVTSAAQSVASNLVKGQLVVLESTTYPGTTRDVLLPILNASGLKVGEDYFLAFSPERVDPGNTKFGIRNTPKVIGGIDDRSTILATALYAAAVEQCVPVGSPEVAEMSKLVENTFRAVNIGFANEVAIMCDLMDIDVWEVVSAASTKPFGFMPFNPGAGVGGHCIPLDPLYLSWKMKSHNYRARFIEVAHEINSRMPAYVINKIMLAMNQHRKSPNGSRILVLGVAYKPNIDDMRESPALDIIRGLDALGAEIIYHDPYVGELMVGELKLVSQELDSALSGEVDCVVIVTNHRGVDTQYVLDTSRLVIDTCNATHGLAGSAHVVGI